MGVGGAPFLAVQAQTSACLRACPQFTNRGNRRRASVGFADPAGERRWLAPRGGSGVNAQFGREHQQATARVPACALDPAGCAVSPCCPQRVLSRKRLPGAAPPLPRVPRPRVPRPRDPAPKAAQRASTPRKHSGRRSREEQEAPSLCDPHPSPHSFPLRKEVAAGDFVTPIPSSPIVPSGDGRTTRSGGGLGRHQGEEARPLCLQKRTSGRKRYTNAVAAPRLSQKVPQALGR